MRRGAGLGKAGKTVVVERARAAELEIGGRRSREEKGRQSDGLCV
jgi:hypothetical protein